MTLLTLLLLAGCQRGCQRPSPGKNASADAIREGNLQALDKTLEEQGDHNATQETSIELEQLRKNRPLVEWVSILVKRNQLIAIRLLRSSSQMCPSSSDAGQMPLPKSLKEAMGRTVNATKELWDTVGLHRIRGTPLHLAAFFCQPSMIERLLNNGADVSAADEIGMTPLHWASCAQAASALVAAKADVNVASRDGWTPLHVAVSAPVARLLVSHGARVNVRDACGNQPLHTASYFGLRRSGGFARAVDGGEELPAPGEPQWPRVLVRLLDSAERNVSHLVELLDVRSALLEAGADPSARNAAGRAPDDIVSRSDDFDD